MATTIPQRKWRALARLVHQVNVYFMAPVGIAGTIFSIARGAFLPSLASSIFAVVGLAMIRYLHPALALRVEDEGVIIHRGGREQLVRFHDVQSVLRTRNFRAGVPQQNYWKVAGIHGWVLVAADSTDVLIDALRSYGVRIINDSRVD